MIMAGLAYRLITKTEWYSTKPKNKAIGEHIEPQGIYHLAIVFFCNKELDMFPRQRYKKNIL